MIGVIGDASVRRNSEKQRIAEELGERLVDAGYRVACGGLGGVMEHVCRGAHASEAYVEGSTVGILPGTRRESANRYVDVIVPTGMNHARNALVPQSDAVVAVGGGAGTLSELAFAWIMDRLIVALEVDGWSGRLAGERIDGRSRATDADDDRIYGASDAATVVATIDARLEAY